MASDYIVDICIKCNNLIYYKFDSILANTSISKTSCPFCLVNLTGNSCFKYVLRRGFFKFEDINECTPLNAEEK